MLRQTGAGEGFKSVLIKYYREINLQLKHSEELYLVWYKVTLYYTNGWQSLKIKTSAYSLQIAQIKDTETAARFPRCANGWLVDTDSED